MKKILLPGVIFLMLLPLTSCLKDYDFEKLKVSDWNPDFAAPLVSSKLTMADIAENSEGFLYENPSTQQMYLIYESKVTTGVIDDFLVIPDQFLNTEEGFFMPPLIPGDSFVLVYGQQYEMNLPGGERLDSLRINGIFSFEIESNINHSGKLEIELPFVRCNGEILRMTLDHIYTGSLPVFINYQVDLSSCAILPSTQGTTYNILEPKYKLTLYGDNNPNQSPYTIKMGESLTDIDFFSAFGDLESKEESLHDTLYLDAFNSVMLGGVAIDSVILKLLVRNSFGLPVRIIPQELWGYSAVNPPYKFYVTDLPGVYSISAPVLAQIGQFAETSITIRSNDLAEILNNTPTKFFYNFVGQLNPLPGAGSNFILDTSRVDMNVQLEVPLSGSVSGLVLEDTVAFDFSDLEELKTAAFRIKVSNTFPLEAELQAYMLDENDQVIDSLFTGYSMIIASGAIGPAPELRILSPGSKTSDVIFSQSRLDNLLLTNNLLLKGRLRTTNGARVKVYSDAYLQVNIGANAQLSVSLDD